MAETSAGTKHPFIKRHPVLTYYALVFAIWGGILIVIGGPGAILGTRQHVFEV